MPDPVWKRLGLAEPPTLESGRGVGVVILDDAELHPALRHLGNRLKHVTVDTCGNVTLVEPLSREKIRELDRVDDSHGVPSLLQMAAAPFQVRDASYIGLAPGATYFVVPYDGRDEWRMNRALEWVVENRAHWNIRVILNAGWQIASPTDPRWDGLIKNTREYPVPRALKRASEAGILVVAANGNTTTINLLPPADYLAVGAYHDSGRADPKFHRENLDEPWGRNADGHLRPDLLAPKYHVPNHVDSHGELGDFGGTSSGSAQVAGLCALLFARFPKADAPTMKHALIRYGDRLPGSKRAGVRVNAARAIQALNDQAVSPPWPLVPPVVTVTDPNVSLDSKDAVERALAISALAENPARFRPIGNGSEGKELRQVFWRFLTDDSPMVRKAACSALRGPESKKERTRLWEVMQTELDMGVRGNLALLLLSGAGEDRLDDWIPLATDPNWTSRWCLVKMLKVHHPDAPHLEHALIPEDIETLAKPILDWYAEKLRSR
ncbi:S8 family serine peptidase [Singulisphaera sp. Ch08]|uniref:S8 family serine peptidase n=1 Tax=Singulisphaera sp. Ch08 TaxID=3120278 RepID=A0AAU7CGB0_9BACT